MFKSSWDLFSDEPHSRNSPNFIVKGKFMLPRSWFDAVLWFLPLHFKAYIFEIENTSLSPTGSQAEKSTRSKWKPTVRGLAQDQLAWRDRFFEIHSFHFQVLSCHQISPSFQKFLCKRSWNQSALNVSFRGLGATECACMRSDQAG